MHINLFCLWHFRCEAANDFLNVTKKSKEAKLTVITRHENQKSFNSVSLFPQTFDRHTPLIGSDLALACASGGYPPPTTSWTFIPQYTNTETAQHRALLNSSSGLAVLELKNVTIADTGVYICSVRNITTNSTKMQVSESLVHHRRCFHLFTDLSQHFYISEHNRGGTHTAYVHQKTIESSLSEWQNCKIRVSSSGLSYTAHLLA